MIKFGIYKKDLIIQEKLKDIFGREKDISILLYEKCKSNNLSETQEIILNRIRFGKVFKRTNISRFDEFDKLTIEIINKRFDVNDILCIHDAAVSDGRATLNLYCNLNKLYRNRLYYTASDILPYVLVIKLRNSDAIFITSEDYDLIEVSKPPFVFNYGRNEHPFYLINHIIKKYYKLYFNRVLRTDKSTLESNIIRKIALIYPDCLNLMESNENFSFIRLDILKESKKKYNVIRAMNILNPSYFSRKQIKQIANNFNKSLLEEGLLIVGSNEQRGSVVDGGIFIKNKDTFVLLKSTGNGCRVNEDIINYNENN